MTKSKLDPRTEAAEKLVLKPILEINLPDAVKEAADAKALEDLLKKADAAEKQKD